MNQELTAVLDLWQNTLNLVKGVGMNNEEQLLTDEVLIALQYASALVEVWVKASVIKIALHKCQVFQKKIAYIMKCMIQQRYQCNRLWKLFKQQLQCLSLMNLQFYTEGMNYGIYRNSNNCVCLCKAVRSNCMELVVGVQSDVDWIWCVASYWFAIYCD